VNRDLTLVDIEVLTRLLQRRVNYLDDMLSRAYGTAKLRTQRQADRLHAEGLRIKLEGMRAALVSKIEI